MAKFIDDTKGVPDADDAPTPNRLAKFPDRPLKLIKFGADWCGHCVAMEKSQVLQKHAAQHPDLELIIVDAEEEEDMADEYEVQSMPMIFFEDKDGFILAEHEGGVSQAQLEKLYAKAKAKVAAK
jgi:thioredoxin-like negative regulator of GroEL